MDAKERERRIIRTSMVGIGTNVLLACFKAAVGMIAGSIAVVLDAVNNLTDAVSSVITIAGVKLAQRKPSLEHPYGHGRIEYFSAILISLIILAAGGMSLYESAKKILHPEMPDYSAVTVIIVVSAIAVKLLLGAYVSQKGKELRSDALRDSGADARLDALISAATLAGIAVALIFGITLDGWIGAVIALFVLKAGLEMLMGSAGDVMGRRADSALTGQIKRDIARIPGVLGAYDLILHNYGPEYAICSVHVEVPGDMTANEIYRMTMEIEQMMSEKYRINTTVGIYAVDAARQALREEIAAAAQAEPGVVGTHGFLFDDAAKTVSLDVGIDFTVTDREALAKKIADTVYKKTGYSSRIHFDAYFSD